MIGTRAFSRIAKRALVERLGIGIAALVAVQHRQIVQGWCDIRMIGTKRLFISPTSA